MDHDFEPFYGEITKCCQARYASGGMVDAIDLASEIMAREGFPMHAPVHHYLVPAVLLTACRKAQGHGIDVLDRDLAAALERARNILGGFCGFYGACGACVGVGIFWSLILDASPLSGTAWAHANRATGRALLDVADVGGPRCCKRCTYLSLSGALPQIRSVLGLELTARVPLCRFHRRNAECLRERCPYWEGRPVPLTPPTFAFPKPDPEHPCSCQSRPVELTHKTGVLFWLKKEGETVAEGEPVAELEVEKKRVEIPAPVSGVLERRLLKDGSTVDGASVLGHLRRDGAPHEETLE